MRLNKYLALAGIASRRKADEMINENRVAINGAVVRTLGVDVTPDDMVVVDGKVISINEKPVVYLLHKPAGTISSVSDPQNRKTVIDLIRDKRRLYPVGRLDRDTTGALLITNMGELSNMLTHPRYGVKKIYVAEAKGSLSKENIAELAKGIRVGEGMRVRAKVLHYERRGKKIIYVLELNEGKNREIKRIFKHYDIPLMRLHRRSFAGITADDMTPGKYRLLKSDELRQLRDVVDVESLKSLIK